MSLFTNFQKTHAKIDNVKQNKLTNVYIGWTWNDVTYLWSQYDRHFVGQHRRTVRILSGEDLSRYSNKIESVGLRKCSY